MYRHMPYGQGTWDLTSVLYAVRPEKDYFGLSPPGRVIVEDDGMTRFQPEADGIHRYLTVNPQQAARVVDAFITLCSRPPDKARVGKKGGVLDTAKADQDRASSPRSSRRKRVE